ncbi:hypothetical protein LPUS_05287 [Lasallia pustulata]|uniref:Uncharacterized protein n=1 Tax=Lasallia pustulata TaxID=136370 RepID=A0A1W5CYT5_9LECA|nr:hypothetical protein LPUS_05287 [Lasallia pustulata]
MVSTTLDPPSATLLPTRPRTHPLRVTHKKKGANKGDAFNPEELCRRLERYRLEEKETRRRRRAQASEKKGEPAQYHHVPQCAAASFARTATPDSRKKEEIHKLSRQAIQIQQPAVEPRLTLANNGPSVRRLVEEQEMSRLKVEASADRNQFQRTPALEEAARADHSRNLNKPQQRDFDIRLSLDLPSKPRPPNGGDISEWDPSKIESTGPSRHIHARPNPNDRHDWAQREDSGETDRHGLRDRMTPFSEIVRRFGGGKERASPNSTVDVLGDGGVDDSGGKKASRRKSSFMSLPLFKKH